MKKSVLPLLVLVCVLVCSAVYADHTVHFTYDAAGNRTQRTIILPAASPARRGSSALADSTTYVFTDTFANLTLNVSPNPTHGHLKLELSGLPEEATYSYIIVNMIGEIIVQEDKAGNPSEADLSGCAAGIYLLRLSYREYIKDYKIIKL